MNKASCSTTQYRQSSSKDINGIELHTTFYLCHPHPDTMCSVMSALTSVQLSMAQYVAVFTCESKYRFDKQTTHPFTTWELKWGNGTCKTDDAYLQTMSSYNPRPSLKDRWTNRTEWMNVTVSNHLTRPHHDGLKILQREQQKNLYLLIFSPMLPCHEVGVFSLRN